MRFGKWKPVSDISMSVPTSALVSAPSLSQKAVIADVKAGKSRQTVERKKYPQLVNMLKESI